MAAYQWWGLIREARWTDDASARAHDAEQVRVTPHRHASGKPTGIVAVRWPADNLDAALRVFHDATGLDRSAFEAGFPKPVIV